MRRATENRTLTDYERDEMTKYGWCYDCGGPRTSRLSASMSFDAITAVPSDVELQMSMYCLWCGGDGT